MRPAPTITRIDTRDPKLVQGYFDFPIGYVVCVGEEVIRVCSTKREAKKLAVDLVMDTPMPPRECCLEVERMIDERHGRQEYQFHPALQEALYANDPEEMLKLVRLPEEEE